MKLVCKGSMGLGTDCGQCRRCCEERDARISALEAQLEARSRPTVGEAWQPIETAPKDGTVVFVWHVKRVNPYAGFDVNIKKGRYLPELEEWQLEGVGGNLPPEVSHWMPLPGGPCALSEDTQ